MWKRIVLVSLNKSLEMPKQKAKILILIPALVLSAFSGPSLLCQVTEHTPIAEFSLDTTTFCSLPHSVILHSASINADKIAWWFNDRFVSANPDTVFQLNKEDMPSETWKQMYSHSINRISFRFTLIAYNSGGATDTMIHEIVVSKPVARFTADKVSGCVPLTVNFADVSQSPFDITTTTYYIGNTALPGTSGATASFTFTMPGEYFVKEIIKTDNCIDTSYMVAVLAGQKLTPTLTVTPNEVCTGGKIHVNAGSNNNSSVDQWKIASGTDFEFSFPTKPDTMITVSADSAGWRDVSLQMTYNGCRSEITLPNAYLIKGPVGRLTQSFSCDSPLVYVFKSDSVTYRFPASGDYPVALTAFDAASSCSLSRTMTAKVRQVDAGFMLSDTILCVGDTLELDAATSNDYINTCVQEGFLWNFGDDSPPRRTFLTDYNHVYNSRGTDTIRLYVLADNGCLDSLSQVVQVFRPEGSFTTDTTAGCLPGVPIEFTNTSADTSVVRWKWDFGDNSFADSVLTITHTYNADSAMTCYPILTVYDRHQCFSITSIPIELVEGIIETVKTDTTVYYGNSILLKVHTGQDNLVYVWTPDYNITCLDCANPIVSPTYDVTYLVKASRDCYRITETINVDVVRDFYLEAPTAFTPNGDANNDEFRFESANIQDFELNIFNRWGEIVFSTHDVTSGWDGTVKGRLQNMDTYVWVAKATSTHGYSFEKRGNFILLK
jgi:gliding motility-associated-like protein